MFKKNNKKKGFTLVEVIMTGAILAFGIVSIWMNINFDSVIPSPES